MKGMYSLHQPLRAILNRSKSHFDRHYGALQGLDKQETVNKYGIDQVTIWRRSYDVPPPECELDSPHYPKNDPKYAEDGFYPRTESLATTLERVLPYWKNTIAPSVLSGKKVLIAAHGNSLRALVMMLEGLSQEEILAREIGTGEPIIYDISDTGTATLKAL